MTPAALQKTIDRGVAWVALATALVAICDVVALALLLHFWLDAEDFGVVSAVVTILPALTVLAELGLPAALVAGEAPDDTRSSTSFWVTVAAGAGLYALLAAVAPWLAAAQGRPEMTALYRAAGLILLVRPAYLTHRSLLRRALRFEELSRVRVAANVVELALKLGLAAAGFGVWALALAPVGRELVYAVGVPAYARWAPKLRFRRGVARAELSFGLRTSASEVLVQVYTNLDYQVVSATFGATALGLYRAAFELVIEPVRFVSEVVTVVAFPTFVRLRHDPGAVAQQLGRFAQQNLAVVLPLLGLIVLAAEELLTVLLGARYAPAADAARVLALVGVLRALSHLGPPLLDGLGRPGLTLRYHITAAFALTIAFFVAATWGADAGYLAIAVAWAAGYPLAFIALAILVAQTVPLRGAGLARRLARIALGFFLATLAAALVKSALPAELSSTARLLVIASTQIAAALLAARLLGLWPIRWARP